MENGLMGYLFKLSVTNLFNCTNLCKLQLLFRRVAEVFKVMFTFFPF